MHILKFISIILLLSGVGFFAAGLWLYWTTNPISNWASVLIMIGIIVLLGAIILLIISLQYEIKPLAARLKQN